MNTGRALGENRRGKVKGMGLQEARGLSVCFYLRPLLGSRTDHSSVTLQFEPVLPSQTHVGSVD